MVGLLAILVPLWAAPVALEPDPLAPVSVGAPELPPLVPERLAAFVRRAEEEHTSALLVAREGRTVYADAFGGDLDRPTFAMSVSKSVVAVGLGPLVTEHGLALDAPLRKWLPEWKDERGDRTLRQVMHHVSGLDTTRWAPGAQATLESHFLATPVVSPAGAFAYNNNVTDGLAVLARRAHPEGLPLDDHLTSVLERPLGISGAVWMKDPVGTPRAAGELLIRPVDLLKLGQLVLDRGVWQGEQVVAADWIDTLLAPGPVYQGLGLLWWREKSADGTLLYRADGYLGQFVVIVPSERLVVVRLRDPRRTSWSSEEFVWKGYTNDVFALTGHPEKIRWPQP